MTTRFKNVNYSLNDLVSSIEIGDIGLPSIQRPFVWKNTKVRDLFDSMYKGYPVGYLLLWQNGLTADRVIGSTEKQKSPSLVIVDGQQRLTSLYAVIKGKSVVRENYEQENITIAFSPLEERFEVTDAAVRRDKSFIPDISCVWDETTGIFGLVENYLDELKKSREVTHDDVRRIQKSVEKLNALIAFPFTALELSAEISEEHVSDVFVRINSKGTQLNQADFILTLMSVFWDEGRDQLERFCYYARKPTKRTDSPFNYFIEPSPDQLLRVGVGVAFKRARLRFVYSILRGKDLETGEFSEDRRIKQFERLRVAQDRVLNIQYWHDFLNCIRLAGFRSRKMLSSDNNLIFSYILYLIGRTEYKVNEDELRSVIAQWFFMSSLTGRFTSSPESKMEFDLAQLRNARTPKDFVNQLRRVCSITLTSDFWSVTLPNSLATSSQRSPALFAYNASLVLLNAPTLFSKMKLAEFLDPAIHAKRSMIERHHLFPVGFLKSTNRKQIREINQIANYAYVEYKDNLNISNSSPDEYLPQFTKRFTDVQVRKLYEFHALPENWEQMEYETFLEKRRELMAKIIQHGYQTLTADLERFDELEKFELKNVLEFGESNSVEFKSTLRTNLHTNRTDSRMEFAVLKTLASFLNTDGGNLIVGVSDDGIPLGIEVDGFKNEDAMNLHLVNIVNSRMGQLTMLNINTHFEDYEDNRVFVARCKRASDPVFLHDGKHELFYIRTGPATIELSGNVMQNYIKQRFS